MTTAPETLDDSPVQIPPPWPTRPDYRYAGCEQLDWTDGEETHADVEVAVHP